MVLWLKQFFDYFGGAADEPPAGLARLLNSPAIWGLWWGVLGIIIMLFSGQTSKFIYIDF